MSVHTKKPEDEMPALPETFLDQFRCCKCTKYLRPPIRTVCKKGHYVCGNCFTALGMSNCPVSPKCQRIWVDMQNAAVETMMKSLKLPMSCKNHAIGCNFSGSLEDVIAQEEDCPYRSVKCLVLSCYQAIRFNGLENHMGLWHPKMSKGDWEIIRPVGADDTGRAGVLALANRYTCACGYFCPQPHIPTVTNPTYCLNCRRASRYNMPLAYAMRSWRHGGIRFFATVFTGDDASWALWVTAACGQTAAEKFRAEIRLSSNLTPECNNVYYRPVLHLESPILCETSLDGYAACLQVHQKTVAKHIKGAVAIADLPTDTAIPFTVNVYEKVFLTADKADIEEKDESARVPE